MRLHVDVFMAKFEHIQVDYRGGGGGGRWSTTGGESDYRGNGGYNQRGRWSTSDRWGNDGGGGGGGGRWNDSRQESKITHFLGTSPVNFDFLKGHLAMTAGAPGLEAAAAVAAVMEVEVSVRRLAAGEARTTGLSP